MSFSKIYEKNIQRRRAVNSHLTLIEVEALFDKLTTLDRDFWKLRGEFDELFPDYQKYYYDRGFGDGREFSPLGEAITALQKKVRQREEATQKDNTTSWSTDKEWKRYSTCLELFDTVRCDLIRLRKDFEGRNDHAYKYKIVYQSIGNKEDTCQQTIMKQSALGQSAPEQTATPVRKIRLNLTHTPKPSVAAPTMAESTTSDSESDEQVNNGPMRGYLKKRSDIQDLFTPTLSIPKTTAANLPPLDPSLSQPRAFTKLQNRAMHEANVVIDNIRKETERRVEEAIHRVFRERMLKKRAREAEEEDLGEDDTTEQGKRRKSGSGSESDDGSELNKRSAAKRPKV